MTDWLSGNRRFLLRLLGTLMAVVLIVVLVRKEGGSEVLAALRQISLTQILFTLILILISRLFVAARWYILLRSGGVKIHYSDSAALTFTGLFATNFLPTTIGGDIVRLFGAMQMGFDRAVCLASIAADRLIGMLGMIFTLPFGLIPIWNLGSGATQFTAFMSFFPRIKDFIKRTLQTFSTWIKQPLSILFALACSWGHMLCTFWTLYLLVEDLGAHVDFWLIAGIWSVSYFVTLVPISINGYGVQELSLTILFSKLGGLNAASSLTVAVLIRILYMAASLPGAAYMPTILAAMSGSRNADDL